LEEVQLPITGASEPRTVEVLFSRLSAMLPVVPLPPALFNDDFPISPLATVVGGEDAT
jgi:hypothetical protein